MGLFCSMQVSGSYPVLSGPLDVVGHLAQCLRAPQWRSLLIGKCSSFTFPTQMYPDGSGIKSATFWSQVRPFFRPLLFFVHSFIVNSNGEGQH